MKTAVLVKLITMTTDNDGKLEQRKHMKQATEEIQIKSP